MALINEISQGRFILKVSDGEAKVDSPSNVNGSGTGASFDKVSLGNSLTTVSSAFSNSYLRLSGAATSVNVSEAALNQLLDFTNQLIGLAEEAADSNSSTGDRNRLNSKYQKLVGDFRQVLNGTTSGETDFLSKDDLRTILEEAGVDPGAATKVSEFFSRIGGRDKKLGYERIRSEDVLIGGTVTITEVVTTIEEEIETTTGLGTFQSAVTHNVGVNARTMVSADFDGDGNEDIVVGSPNNVGVLLYLGNGDGEFQGVVTLGAIINSQSSNITAYDVDGDDDIDILNVSPNAGVMVHLNNGDGTFLSPISYLTSSASSVAFGDVNGDNVGDVVNLGGTILKVSFGNSNGSFNAFMTSSAPATYFTTTDSLEVADFNGDTFGDVVSFGSDGVSIMFSNGDGTFLAPATLESDFGYRVGGVRDFDNDGTLDIIAISSETGGGNIGKVFISNGDGTFDAGITFIVDQDTRSISSFDSNGDGNLDIAIAGAASGDMLFLLGNGDGSFGAITTYAAGVTVPSTIIHTDFDNDGVDDLAMAGLAGNAFYTFLGNTTTTTTTTSHDETTYETTGSYEYARASSSTDPLTQTLRTRGEAQIAVNTLKKLRTVIEDDLKGIDGTRTELGHAAVFAFNASKVYSDAANSISSFNDASSLALSLATRIRALSKDEAIGPHSNLDRAAVAELLG